MVLAVIPYTTFPTLALGPLELRTFGLMVGAGILIGAWLAARHAERLGIAREDTYRLATKMVVGGIIGARLTWDLTHWDQIDSPLDLVAVWQGGLQFSGGFLAAVAIGAPAFRRLPRSVRWADLDGYAYGLTLGLAIGRIGCYAVGEHFGSATEFFLGTRYDGGSVREPTLGDQPLVQGTTFHNTSLYELLFLLVIFGLLTVMLRRRARAGSVVGIFCVAYGMARFLTDFLRVNDETTLGLTGAQWMCLGLIPAGLWIVVRARPPAAQPTTTKPAEGPGEPLGELEEPEEPSDLSPPPTGGEGAPTR